jgi:hypothetical protein
MSTEDIFYEATKGFTGDLASELIDQGVMDDLLPPQKSYQRKYRDTVRQVLYNLVRAQSQSNARQELVTVAIPLTNLQDNEGHWSRDFFSYHRIRKVLDTFQDEDLVSVQRGVPAHKRGLDHIREAIANGNKPEGKVTTFFAAGDLQQAIQNLLESRTDLASDVEIIVDHSNVWLKNGGVVDWVDDKPEMRQRVEDVNNATPTRGTLAIPKRSAVRPSGAPAAVSAPIRDRTSPPDAGRLPDSHREAMRKCATLWSWERRETDTHILYRIPESAFQYERKFCRGSFDCGGRYYADVQNIPSDWRQFVALEGEDVVELDFDNLHFHMLYAERRKRLEGDAYDVGHIALDRSHLKLVANVMVNARNSSQLYSCLHNAEELDGYSNAEIKEAVHALKDRHQPIQDAFHSDAGIRLQNEDSRIAERVMLKTGAVGIHDGFMAPAAEEQRLRRAMKIAFSESYNGYEIPVSREHE